MTFDAPPKRPVHFGKTIVVFACIDMQKDLKKLETIDLNAFYQQIKEYSIFLFQKMSLIHYPT